MDRGLKPAGIALLLGAGLALTACAGDGPRSQSAGCIGGSPDGGGITDMSPYSPSAGSFQPDCQGRG